MGIVNKKLMVGLNNGAIEQWDGDGTNLNIKTWSEPHDSSLGSQVSQILDYNGAMVARFANSLILQNVGGNSWRILSVPSSSSVTQMGLFKGSLIVGLADGTIIQFDNSNSSSYALPNANVGSSVKQIVDNGNLIVGFANGSFAQWDGSTWAVITPHAGHAITQMMVQ
jgi:hypothetical protein